MRLLPRKRKGNQPPQSVTGAGGVRVRLGFGMTFANVQNGPPLNINPLLWGLEMQPGTYAQLGDLSGAGTNAGIRDATALGVTMKFRGDWIRFASEGIFANSPVIQLGTHLRLYHYRNGAGAYQFVLTHDVDSHVYHYSTTFNPTTIDESLWHTMAFWSVPGSSDQGIRLVSPTGSVLLNDAFALSGAFASSIYGHLVAGIDAALEEFAIEWLAVWDGKPPIPAGVFEKPSTGASGLLHLLERNGVTDEFKDSKGGGIATKSDTDWQWVEVQLGPDTTPASIEVPATFIIAQGETARIAPVYVKNAAGDVLDGVVPTSWNSAHPARATVDSDGDVTGVDDNTSTTITASIGAVTSNSCALTIIPAFSDADEPAGSVMLNRYVPRGTTVLQDGWDIGTSPANQLYVEDDVTATFGKRVVMRFLAGTEASVTAVTRGTPTTLVTAPNHGFAADIRYLDGWRSMMLKNYNGGSAGDGINIVDFKGSIVDANTIALTNYPDHATHDSTGWAAYSGSGAVIRFGAGIGGAHLEGLPVETQASYAPNVTFEYVRFMIDSDYLGNDGAGSQKFIHSYLKPDYYNYTSTHDPGFYGNPTNPTADITASISIILADQLNGVARTPDNAQVDFPTLVTRNVWHTMKIKRTYPPVRGDVTTMTLWYDGTNIGTYTYRQLGSSPPGAGVPYAFRWAQMVLDNVYGGGGTCPPVDLKMYFDQLYISGSWSDPDLAPDHWTLSSEEGTSRTTAQTTHIVGLWENANNQLIDQYPGWGTTGSDPDFVITASNGATWAAANVEPVTPGKFRIVVTHTVAGTVTVTYKLWERARNNQRTGNFTTGSINLTVS